MHLSVNKHSMLDTTDSVLMSNSVDYREPETNQGSLLLSGGVRVSKNLNALFERQVMQVVPTPPGA